MQSRPRLFETINYFQSLERQGINEASQVLIDYNKLKESHGEFIAGRYIIDVYVDMFDYSEEVATGE